MISPKIIMGGAALLLLAGRAKAAKTAPVVPASVRHSAARVQNFANPGAVADAAAALVNRMLYGAALVPKLAPASVAVGEAARAAVRVDDPYYGQGANAWYVGNKEAALQAVRAGDSYYAGWNSGAVAEQSGGVDANNVDGIIGGNFSSYADMMAEGW